MERIYENYAPKYFERGLIVTPLIRNDKRPVLKDWTNKIIYKNYEKIIDENPCSNIGLLLGEISGVIAIDIDKDSGLKLCPLSPVVKKGKKGETRFFKYNGEISRKRHDLGIELLSNGNQTVLPPSIHPETHTAYSWLTVDDLLGFDLKDLPTLSKEFLELFQGQTNPSTSISQSDGTRCNHGSHSKLSEMLVAALHSNDTPDTIAKNLLDYDDAINPDVSYFLCPSRKWKTNSKEANVLAFILEGIQRNLKVGSIDKVNVKEDVKITLVKEAQLTKMKLPKLSGIAQEMFEHIIANSSQDRTHFAFPTAMMAISTILGNKVQFKGITPNLYTLVVGGSGAGKTSSFNFIKDLLISSPLGINLLGPSSITSVNGLTQTLKQCRVQIGVLDEASSLFEKINDKTGLGEAISATLSELYTSTGRAFLGKNVSHAKDTKNTKGNIGGCFAPYVNLLMGTTFDAFEKSFTSNLINRGFFGRGDIYYDLKNMKDRDRESLPMPEKFTAFLEMWRKVKNDSLWSPKSDNIDLEENTHLRPFNIPSATLKADTESLFKEIVGEIRDIKFKVDSNSPVIAMVNRMEVMFIKYAIISAAFNNPDTTTLVISKKDLRFALELVKANTNNAEILISNKMFEGHRKAHMQKILEFIASKEQVTKTDINRKFSKYMPKKQRDEYLSDLKESGLIQEKLSGTARIYSII
jgi:hypothetical protein